MSAREQYFAIRPARGDLHWHGHRRDHPFISQPGDVDLYSNERHSKRDIARPTSAHSSWFTRLSLSTAVQGDICPCPAAGQCFVRPRGGPQDSSWPLTNGDLDRRRPPRPNDFLPHAVSLEDYLTPATIPHSEPSSPFPTWTRKKGWSIHYLPAIVLASFLRSQIWAAIAQTDLWWIKNETAYECTKNLMIIGTPQEKLQSKYIAKLVYGSRYWLYSMLVFSIQFETPNSFFIVRGILRWIWIEVSVG